MTATMNSVNQQVASGSDLTVISLVVLGLLIGLLVLREIARSSGGPAVRQASRLLPIFIGPLLISFLLLLSLRLGSLLAE